jgi:hypothetical protein
VQPILGLLRDMADVIASSVAAPRAEDEWLEAGLRKAFERFAENHALFLEHFPLDPQREAIYAATPVDEDKASGAALSKPFEAVGKATAEAHKEGVTTDVFLGAMDRMVELARVRRPSRPSLYPASSQPRQLPSAPKGGRSSAPLASSSGPTICSAPP